MLLVSPSLSLVPGCDYLVIASVSTAYNIIMIFRAVFSHPLLRNQIPQGSDDLTTFFPPKATEAPEDYGMTLPGLHPNLLVAKRTGFVARFSHKWVPFVVRIFSPQFILIVDHLSKPLHSDPSGCCVNFLAGQSSSMVARFSVYLNWNFLRLSEPLLLVCNHCLFPQFPFSCYKSQVKCLTVHSPPPLFDTYR